MKTAARHISEAALPKRHLVGLFRACSSYPPRVVKSTEQITELGRLTRELVRFLRHPWRLLGAMGRFRRSENQSESARTACLPNHIATTDMRAARMRKYNLANIAGHGPVTALGWSVPSWLRFFWPGDRVTREVNRCRDAHEAPGPVSRLLSVFSPPTWSLPPGK